MLARAIGGTTAGGALQAREGETPMTIRIWVQSFTDLSALPGYEGMLRDHARRICGPETVVDVHGVRPGTYPGGMAPIEMIRYRWADHLLSVQVVENAIRAEREGYDAVAISCFLDPGLEAARGVVDIPVVSSCETALLVSSAVGRAVGLVAIDGHMATILRELVARYGYRDRVATVATLDPPITEHELDRAFAGAPEFVEHFARQVSPLIDAGADVIIPAEGVINSALVRNRVQEIAGAPVLDSYGALLAFAEMLVGLRRHTGLSVGRRGAYVRPPAEIIPHLRRMTIEALQDARKRNSE